ncbi:MAG: dihydroorotate dehydrogenase electron transfer subunit [Eubacteriales bacterium]
MKKRETVKILSNKEIERDVFDLRLAVNFEEKPRPGQFVNMYTNDASLLLPRPISICDFEGNELRLVYRVSGKGTKLISTYERGEWIDITGPLGNGNMIYNDKNPGRNKDFSGAKTVLVGGGIGTPPMLFLAKELKKMGSDVNVVLSFKCEPVLEEDFIAAGVKTYVATSDGSRGFHGNGIEFIKQENLLKGAKEVFSCGPKGLLRALGNLAGDYDIPCQLSLEERMGCGYGACAGCVCKIDNGSQIVKKGVCKAGPIFYADTVVWED